MKFSEFSKYLEKLEATSSRIEMTKTLAKLFKKASGKEIDKICYLSLGRLGPLYELVEFNIAEKIMIRILARAYGVGEAKVRELYKKLGDFGTTAEKLAMSRGKSTPFATSGSGRKHREFSVAEVFEKLFEIATVSGTGSQEKKVTWMAGILSRLDPLSCRFVVRIPLGKLRLGIADKTLIEGLSWMLVGDKSLKSEIEKAYFVYPNVGEVARRIKKGGIKNIQNIKVEIGVPLLPQLLQRIGTAEEIIDKMGKVIVEPKYDGTRVQLHFSRRKKWKEPEVQTEIDFGEISEKGFVKTFSRNLEETTQMFPEFLEAVWDQLDATEAILDGEAMGYNPKTEEFLPFQEIVQRKRKYGIAEKVSKVPLKLFVFDLLFLNGKDLLNLPLSERRRLLERTLKEGKVLTLSPHIVTGNPATLLDYFEKMISRGLEGVVVKKVDSVYAAGSRGFSWVKFKREGKSELKDTIDCVVLGYNKGAGKRAEFGIGAFLVGVYNESEDRFESISKVGTGLTDEQWREMKKRCDKIKVSKKLVRVKVSKNLAQDVWVEPFMVVEILADEITRSPVHTAGVVGSEPGYALRFPRLIRWRDDKSAEEVTTVKEVKRLFKLQSKKH